MSDGKKPISKAPPPIEPVRGSGYFVPTRAVPPKPNWEEEWNHTPEAPLWQACALSLNIEPHSMKHSGTSWMAPGGGPSFTDESFPSNVVKDKFKLRLRVLIKNIDSEHFSPYIVTGRPAAYHDVRLDEFAAWASKVVKWDGLPAELLALAKAPSPQAQDATQKKKRTTEFDAVIDAAKKKAKDSSDYHSVWVALKEMALNEETPFSGSVDPKQGLQYTNDSNRLEWFSKDALRKRMNRAAR